MLQRVIFRFVLYYMIGVVFTFPICLFAAENAPQAAIKSTDIPNHHIFYRKDKRAPLTKIEIVFLGAGRNQEPPSQNGLAEIASRLILKSAKKQGYRDQWAALGTELGISIDTISLAISISALSEKCAESVEIVHDLIHNLEFSESDLQEAKKQQADYYQSSLRRNTYLFMKSFALTKTKGIKQYKSLKTLNNLSLEDIKQYYARLLKTEVVFFKVISDLDSTEVAKLLHPITEKRETGGFVHSLAYSAIDHHYDYGPSAFVFNRTHSKNILCYWLIPCGRKGEEDYVPAMISTTLKQDTASGLLYTYFREELGLVYNIHCNYSSADDVRLLGIIAEPPQHNSEELIQKMSEFILQLPDNSRFWAGLREWRKSNLIPQRRLDSEVYRAIYNPPIRKGGYDSVTDDEVRAFLEKFFVLENMIMLFLGPKDHIIDILNKHLPEVDIRVHDVKELIE